MQHAEGSAHVHTNTKTSTKHLSRIFQARCAAWARGSRMQQCMQRAGSRTRHASAEQQQRHARLPTCASAAAAAAAVAATAAAAAATASAAVAAGSAVLLAVVAAAAAAAAAARVAVVEAAAARAASRRGGGGGGSGGGSGDGGRQHLPCQDGWFRSEELGRGRLKRGPTTPPPERWCDGTSS